MNLTESDNQIKASEVYFPIYRVKWATAKNAERRTITMSEAIVIHLNKPLRGPRPPAYDGSQLLITIVCIGEIRAQGRMMHRKMNNCNQTRWGTCYFKLLVKQDQNLQSM